MQNETVDDADYTEDEEIVPAEDLPEPTDPAEVPKDEGDAKAVRV